jgi:hypothetical protein
LGTILESIVLKRINLINSNKTYSILFIALSCIFGFSNLFSQEYTNKTIGLKLGILANFGSHSNQIGVQLNTYLNYGFAQLNAGNTLTFSFTNLANRKYFVENRSSLGLLLLGGRKRMESDFMWDGLRHQTKYENAVGYNFLWYRDNSGTSQNSGGWTAQFSNFQVFFENDIFAGTGKDKYRTGHLMLGYRYKEFNFQFGTKLWTGETAGSDWRKIHLDNCPSGFRLLEDLPYGKTSHGIAYGGLAYKMPSGNYITSQLGIDSEQVRHLFQNRLSHDMILFPKKMERKTPHYPRLDDFGCPVFFKEDAKKDKIYFKMGLNSVWSY